MKRFMIIALSGAAMVLFVGFLVFAVGIYIPSDPGEDTDLPFRAEGTVLKRRTREGDYVPFTIRGVEVSGSLPGHYATEYAAGKKDYLRWFRQIGLMGANTVKALRIMDDDFYDALYEYNREQDTPLYLLQGIAIGDQANSGAGSAYGEEFQGALISDGRSLVDIIHGRKIILAGGMGGSGNYFRDISRWVIGYVVGSDWNADMIAYTDHSALHKDGYEGTYFSAGEEATSFEAMLAQVMDEITAYETEKYHSQRPIGFLNSPAYDFLRYEENYAVQLKKYSYLDQEHVLAGSAMKAGCFAAYRLFSYCDDFSSYLSAEQKQEYAKILEELDRTSCYEGYLQFLARHHTMPVLASEYGVSSSRGAVSIQQAPCTEQEQGEQLLDVYEDATAFGWAGVCISSWQDVWEQKSWNTSFARAMQSRNCWQDVQTEGQSYGLMAFEPGEEECVCTVDGDPGEWESSDEVLSEGTRTLSARYDWKGLYLLLAGEGVNPDTAQYIPIDVAPGVGSRTCASPALSFSRGTDFVLCIDGIKNSRLLVQERYQAVRENFLFDITGQNPFSSFPDKDSAEFVTVQMAVKKGTLAENYALLEPSVRRAFTGFDTWDTGKLVHGNGDPEAEDFCSLADFCFGENCVEIRLPWLLLNVADPVAMQVHEDYYENYGVECEKISRLWLGLAGEEASIPMESFQVKGTGRTVRYHERLKKSYDVLQRAWKEEKERERD